MRFANPLDIACPVCGQHFHESIEWLMQDGRRCPDCHTSFNSMQESISSRIQNWTDLMDGVQFIMNIEERWGIEISDDDACRLMTAESICDFILSSQPDNSTSTETIRAAVYQFAADHLGVNHTGPETDLLGAFRRVARQRT